MNYSHGSAARNGEGAKLKSRTTEILTRVCPSCDNATLLQTHDHSRRMGNYYTCQYSHLFHTRAKKSKVPRKRSRSYLISSLAADPLSENFHREILYFSLRYSPLISLDEQDVQKRFHDHIHNSSFGYTYTSLITCSIYTYVTGQWLIIRAGAPLSRPYRISLSLLCQYHDHTRVADPIILKPLSSPG